MEKKPNVFIKQTNLISKEMVIPITLQIYLKVVKHITSFIS